MERYEIWGSGLFVRVLKFDSPLPEDHRVNTLSIFSLYSIIEYE